MQVHLCITCWQTVNLNDPGKFCVPLANSIPGSIGAVCMRDACFGKIFWCILQVLLEDHGAIEALLAVELLPNRWGAFLRGIDKPK